MSRFRDFAARRILAPIVEQLRGGITPDRIAVAIAGGCSLGLFPILGSTTFLCAIASFVLRLNQPVIQMTNFLIYPLQLALLLVFYRAGEVLFSQPHLPLTIGLLLQRFKSGPVKFIGDYGMVALRGIAVWAVIAPILFALVFLIARAPLRALAAHRAQQHA